MEREHEEFVRKVTLDYHCNLARHLYLGGRNINGNTTTQANVEMRCLEQRRDNIKMDKYSCDWRCKSR